MNNLIPTSGGNNPVNGLPIQHKVAIVFNAQTLEILEVHSGHNRAEEAANTIYVRDKIDARADGLNFHMDEPANANGIVGMKLNQFQHFVENNENHPLCKQ